VSTETHQPETVKRPTGVPATAKLKTIKPLGWEGPRMGERFVWMHETTRNPDYERAFDVYADDGTLLGKIEGRMSSIDTKIAGTRLRREGRRRLLWFPAGQAWNDHESQAAVIRRLLDEHTRSGARA